MMQTIMTSLYFILLLSGFILLFNHEVSGHIEHGSNKNEIGCSGTEQCRLFNKRKLRTNMNLDYTKDTWGVYYRGEKIQGASSMSFKTLNNGYAKDNWNVYYKGGKVEGASLMSFIPLSNGYAKDTWNVYYKGKIMKGVSPSTFTLSHGR
ncbi:hypothetical protein I4U23_029074 [Adineta vaga]|nr:hypothetical protein I4U23_029074 [Adineta vaga]